MASHGRVDGRKMSCDARGAAVRCALYRRQWRGFCWRHDLGGAVCCLSVYMSCVVHIACQTVRFKNSPSLYHYIQHPSLYFTLSKCFFILPNVGLARLQAAVEHPISDRASSVGPLSPPTQSTAPTGLSLAAISSRACRALHNACM